METEIQTKEQQHESNCHVKVAKGKRTKRQATCSTHGTSMCVSSRGGSGDSGDDSSSTLSSSAPFRCYTTKGYGKQKEDEMANYLILLAQGNNQNPNKTGCKIDTTQRNDMFNMSTASTTTNSSMRTYKCKTCNRTFSSFQALGGHRASHKKYKATIEERVSDYPKLETITNNGEESRPKELLNFNNHPLGVQIDKRTMLFVKPKLRVCLVCGMEFKSGQALGGHMRRHRAPLNGNIAGQKLKENLLLDLNLPAPKEDDCCTNFLSTSIQQPLILFNPAPVSYHY